MYVGDIILSISISSNVHQLNYFYNFMLVRFKHISSLLTNCHIVFDTLNMSFFFYKSPKQEYIMNYSTKKGIKQWLQ